MYGVLFDGNPDLRRILTDYGFRGPSAAQGLPADRLCRAALFRGGEARRLRAGRSLPQDFRTFDFLIPWEGAEYVLPGDEKAGPEAPGAPTPAPAPTRSSKADAKAASADPKTTEKPARPAPAPANKAARRASRAKATAAGQPKGAA